MNVARIDELDWKAVAADLDRLGWSVLPKLLNADQCDAVSGMYGDTPAFRSHVVMARHGFGQGEYRYFSYPLPDVVQELRMSLYPKLAPVANTWHDRMGLDVRFPATHAEFLERCHGAGQRRPTPLLLQYGPGDYNCRHQDLYGEHVFPLQVATLLSEPNEAFDGGEFVLTEQRPRMQSRAAHQGRRSGVRRQQPRPSWNQGRLPRDDAARGQRSSLGSSTNHGDHLPRRCLNGRAV